MSATDRTVVFVSAIVALIMLVVIAGSRPTTLADCESAGFEWVESVSGCHVP